MKELSKDLKLDTSTLSYGQATKDKILDVSIDLFSKNGFHNVSIRDIAGEVGMKQSSLYNHFTSKDEILRDIYTLFQAEAAKIFPPLESMCELIATCTPLEFLMQGNHLFLEHMLNHRMEKVWRILFIEQSSDQRASGIILEESYRKSYDFIEAALQKMMVQNKIKNIDTRICTYEYIYPINFMFFEYVVTKFIHKDKTSLEKQIEEHTQFIYHTILEK